MVRNTQGGCKAKSHGRKFSNNYATKTATRLSACVLEVYACVTKLFGQGRCLVHTVGDQELQCIIRNKFRGRSKRNNVVAVGTLLLIGLREWEGPDNYKTCDVLEVYDQEDINQLRSMPSTKIQLLDRFAQNQFHCSSSSANDDLLFSKDADHPTVEKQHIPSEKLESVYEEDEIDIDGI